MNFIRFDELTINRYSGSIVSDSSAGSDYDRIGECIALEEQKF